MPGRSGRSDVTNRLALGDDGSVAPCFAWSPVVVMVVVVRKNREAEARHGGRTHLKLSLGKQPQGLLP